MRRRAFLLLAPAAAGLLLMAAAGVGWRGAAGAVVVSEIQPEEIRWPESARPDGLPKLRAWYAARPDARSWRDAAGLPVLLYFAGWSGAGPDNQSMVRMLAGAGYIVITVEYPARVDGGARLVDFSSAAAFARSVDAADARVRSRARDASRVLDALTGWSVPRGGGLPAARADQTRAGIFGYSIGGAVAAQACLFDPRFRAAANLDGWHFAEAAVQGVSCRYLVISDDSPLPTPSDLESADPARRNMALLNQRDYDQTMINLRRHGGTYIRLAASRHEDFGEAATARGGFWTGFFDQSRGERVRRTAGAYVRAFFDRQLYGKGEGLRRQRTDAASVDVWPPPDQMAPLSGLSGDSRHD